MTIYVANYRYGYGESDLIALCTTLDLAKEMCKQYDDNMSVNTLTGEWVDDSLSPNWIECGAYYIYPTELDTYLA